MAASIGVDTFRGHVASPTLGALHMGSSWQATVACGDLESWGFSLCLAFSVWAHQNTET